MPKNNSKARKAWRRKRAEVFSGEGEKLTPEERLLMAIFGTKCGYSDDERPGTEFADSW